MLFQLDLQLQSFAASDIARGFLGHLGNAIATLTRQSSNLFQWAKIYHF